MLIRTSFAIVCKQTKSDHVLRKITPSVKVFDFSVDTHHRTDCVTVTHRPRKFSLIHGYTAA